eukprot:scaffold1347_cov350-Pavlova_lutheri.AAC.43
MKSGLRRRQIKHGQRIHMVKNGLLMSESSKLTLTRGNGIGSWSVHGIDTGIAPEVIHQVWSQGNASLMDARPTDMKQSTKQHGDHFCCCNRAVYLFQRPTVINRVLCHGKRVC